MLQKCNESFPFLLFLHTRIVLCVYESILYVCVCNGTNTKIFSVCTTLIVQNKATAYFSRGKKSE